MGYFSARVYFKDSQVNGNALVYVEADEHQEAVDKASKKLLETFKSCPGTEVVSVTTTRLKKAPKHWSKKKISRA